MCFEVKMILNLTCTGSLSTHLDISVEADRRVIDALHAFERHRTLLLIVDEEDDDPARKVKQHSYCSSFTDATVRPAQSENENSLIITCKILTI